MFWGTICLFNACLGFWWQPQSLVLLADRSSFYYLPVSSHWDLPVYLCLFSSSYININTYADTHWINTTSPVTNVTWDIQIWSHSDHIHWGWKWKLLSRVQSHGLYNPWNSPGLNAGVGSRSLFKGIFLTQESNRGLLNCRQIFYQLELQGCPNWGWDFISLQRSQFNPSQLMYVKSLHDSWPIVGFQDVWVSFTLH